MARIGVSYPRYAIYKNNGATVSYSDGGSLGRATSVNMDIDGTESNILYADNGPAESANSFAGGTITVGVDDLYDDAIIAILGMDKSELTAPAAAAELVESDDQQPPYVGMGFILKHIQHGKTVWTGVILTKTQFSTHGIDVETEGENPEFQTPELEAAIFRDDTEKRVWRRRAKFDTEANAKAYIDAFLNIGTEGA